MYMLCIKIKRQMQNQYLLVSLFPPLTLYLSLWVGIFDFDFFRPLIVFGRCQRSSAVIRGLCWPAILDYDISGKQS